MVLCLRVAVSCEILPQECFLGSLLWDQGRRAQGLCEAGVEWTQTCLCLFSAVYSEPGELRSGREE